MRSHTVYICVTFLQCVFLDAFSKRLHKRMQSHIDCICLSFLQCVFSNVSSNCLPKWMWRHTVYICVFFLQCEFLDAFSKILHKRMQSDIDCICLTFLHCVFLNVHFLERRHTPSFESKCCPLPVLERTKEFSSLGIFCLNGVKLKVRFSPTQIPQPDQVFPAVSPCYRNEHQERDALDFPGAKSR